MPEKIGGGNKLQEYNPNNGEYVDEQTKELMNAIATYKYTSDGPRPKYHYPIFGDDSIEYAEVIAKYLINVNDPNLSDEKLTGYLLVHKDRNDKSILLSKMGYNMNNWLELKNNIIKGTNFNSRKLESFDRLRFTIRADTRIQSLIDNKEYQFISVWAIEDDFSLRLVTIKPVKERKNV